MTSTGATSRPMLAPAKSTDSDTPQPQSSRTPQLASSPTTSSNTPSNSKRPTLPQLNTFSTTRATTKRPSRSNAKLIPRTPERSTKKYQNSNSRNDPLTPPLTPAHALSGARRAQDAVVAAANANGAAPRVDGQVQGGVQNNGAVEDAGHGEVMSRFVWVENIPTSIHWDALQTAFLNVAPYGEIKSIFPHLLVDRGVVIVVFHDPRTAQAFVHHLALPQVREGLFVPYGFAPNPESTGLRARCVGKDGLSTVIGPQWIYNLEGPTELLLRASLVRPVQPTTPVPNPSTSNQGPLTAHAQGSVQFPLSPATSVGSTSIPPSSASGQSASASSDSLVSAPMSVASSNQSQALVSESEAESLSVEGSSGDGVETIARMERAVGTLAARYGGDVLRVRVLPSSPSRSKSEGDFAVEFYDTRFLEGAWPAFDAQNGGLEYDGVCVEGIPFPAPGGDNPPREEDIRPRPAASRELVPSFSSPIPTSTSTASISTSASTSASATSSHASQHRRASPSVSLPRTGTSPPLTRRSSTGEASCVLPGERLLQLAKDAKAAGGDAVEVFDYTAVKSNSPSGLERRGEVDEEGDTIPALEALSIVSSPSPTAPGPGVGRSRASSKARMMQPGVPRTAPSTPRKESVVFDDQVPAPVVSSGGAGGAAAFGRGEVESVKERATSGPVLDWATGLPSHHQGAIPTSVEYPPPSSSWDGTPLSIPTQYNFQHQHPNHGLPIFVPPPLPTAIAVSGMPHSPAQGSFESPSTGNGASSPVPSSNGSGHGMMIPTHPHPQFGFYPHPPPPPQAAGFFGHPQHPHAVFGPAPHFLPHPHAHAHSQMPIQSFPPLPPLPHQQLPPFGLSAGSTPTPTPMSHPEQVYPGVKVQALNPAVQAFRPSGAGVSVSISVPVPTPAPAPGPSVKVKKSESSEERFARSQRTGLASSAATTNTTSPARRFFSQPSHQGPGPQSIHVPHHRAIGLPPYGPAGSGSGLHSRLYSGLGAGSSGPGGRKPTPEANIVDVEKIEQGLDTRTTVMLKNVPNKMTAKDLISFITNVVPNSLDFLYLRIDFTNHCNVGYAFVNFIDARDLLKFCKTCLGKKWNLFQSEKVLQMSYANYQGKSALVDKFRNSAVLNERPEWRPQLFFSEGPRRGEPHPFPAPNSAIRRERSSFARNEGMFGGPASGGGMVMLGGAAGVVGRA